MSAVAVASAFLRRDFRIAISYRTAFALEFASSLFILALFFHLGRVVDNAEFSAAQNLDGGYFGYAAVGIALLRIVQVSMTSFSTKLREEQTSGTFEALMATPTPPSVVILSRYTGSNTPWVLTLIRSSASSGKFSGSNVMVLLW